METGLRGKTVLLSGASGSIGSAIAKMFDQEKTNLIISYNSGADRIHELEKNLKGEYFSVHADLGREEDVLSLFDQGEARFGRIDILVHCAGIWSEELFISERTLEEWNKSMRLNTTAAFLLSRGFFNNLKKYKGDHASVVYIGSTAGVFGEAKHHDYAAAKSAVMYGMTRSLKNEITAFAKFGRVNSVCPGWCATPMTRGLLEDEKYVEQITATMPLRKVAEATDVASLVVFLASDKTAGHITGEVITVAGGMEGRLLSGTVQ
jgi:3-oxoacyl-[acyl-carrier protein] reductase